MSTSLARLDANRRNAARSTGPRSPRGKAMSRLNAVRHGAYSGRPVLLPGESPAKWARFAAALRRELRPVGPSELLCAGRIAVIQWRLLRCADAREALLKQQWREAIIDAPESAWWKFRRGQEKDVPPSPDELRHELRYHLRARRLLTRAAAAPSTPSINGPEDRSPSPSPQKVDGPAAVILIERAAEHLDVEQTLETLIREQRRFPGGGPVTDILAAEEVAWTLPQVCHGLSEVAGWAGVAFDRLLVSLSAAMDDATRAMRRLARRADRELRAFRRCAAARPSAEGQAFDRLETHLERRLAQAMEELNRLQARRVANVAQNARQTCQKRVQMGFASIETPEKRARVGFVSSEPLPREYNETNAKSP